MKYRLRNFLCLIVSLALTLGIGSLGSIVTKPAIDTWYAEIVKPALTPPNWVFPVVWTTLFIFMGIALFLVWRKGFEKKQVRIAMGIFAVQLVLNFLWSCLFFGLRSPGLALVEIMFLIGAIVWTMVAFSRVSKVAVWLFMPYLLWVMFAAFYLNTLIVMLN